MKKCPNCQKTFDDDKRFCQIDGTPLIEMVEPPPAEDPYKTVVVGQKDIPSLGNLSEDPMKTTVIRADSKDDDILQIPEVFDPMKTMVVSEPFKFDKPAEKPIVEESNISAPEPPKFNEPELAPPSFGDISSSEPPKVEPPPIEPPISNPFSAPPKIDTPIANPFSEPPPFDSPFSAPSKETPQTAETPKFDSKPLPSESSPISSPFDMPQNEPPPSPFQKNEVQAPPFKEPEKPVFNLPSTPFSPSPFEPNQQMQQAEWNPPTPPAQDWQNQSFGGETPIPNTNTGATGQNKTLAIISLVLGVLSFVCGLTFLGAIPAIITGFMQKGKIKANPSEYGGGGMATIGMILGVANVILSIIGIILYALLLASIIRF